MVKNIIIGQKSFVTKSILKYLKNPIVFSANELTKKKIQEQTHNYKKINLVFNNFYPSKLLNDLNHNNYNDLCNLSLSKISLLFETIPSSKINKIIYTSSAAIYRLIENISNQKSDHYNRELYSSFKLVAEKLILNYSCSKNKDYFIMRLFNTYGDSQDKFSFIEKIIRAKKEKTQLSLINEGLSLRDFIHLDDIGKIYTIFLNKKLNKGIYDIGSGKGFLIKDLVNLAKIPKNKLIKKNKIEEIKDSIADSEKLLLQIGDFNFKDLNKYIKNKLKLKNNFKSQTFSPIKKNNLSPSGVVIYGAGYAGKQILSELRKDNQEVLCFVDDNIKLQNLMIHEIPVLSYSGLLKLKTYAKIKRVYLTIPSLNKNSQTKILNKIKKNFFDVRFLPEKKFLLSDQINFNDLNIDEINNILNRKQIKIKR